MLIGCLTVLYPLVEDVPVLSRKDLKIAYITTSMFCALWIGGETAPELGTKVQEPSAWLWCPWLPLQQKLRGLGREHTLYLYHHSGPLHGAVWCVRVSQDAQ